VANASGRLFKVGGISLVLSGVLFLIKIVAELVAGPPPTTGAEILAWAARGRIPLAIVSEALFIAGMLLVPGAVALHASIANREGPRAGVGVGLLVVRLPVLFVTLVIHGRLVYDVYGLRVRDPTAGELTVALYAGGMHVVFLMLAIATLVLSLAMKATYGRIIVGLGMVTTVLDVAAAYPWALGAPLLALCQVAFTAWLVAVGAKLWQLGSEVPAAAS